MVEELRPLGCLVVGLIGDNAANLQKSFEGVKNVLSLNCHAHTLNLLLKDLYQLFSRQFDQMSSLEQFFRLRHVPFSV